MIGEVNLTAILRALRPELHPGEFVYCSVASAPPDINAVMSFREAEGLTLIVAREVADAHSLAHAFPCAWITLRVHSSLAAVGLTAVVAAALADAGIACNMVAAYHHDHAFVPRDRAAEAMEILKRLSGS